MRKAMEPVSEEDLRTAYLDEELSWAQMERRFDVSSRTIQRWMAGYGISARSQNVRIEPASKEDIRKAYEDERLTWAEMTERFGASPSIIRKWMVTYQIPLRGGRESQAEVTPEGIWRKVVGQVEVPYDTDLDGTPITRTMDVLECGHKKPSRVARAGLLGAPNREHRCSKCEREAGGS